MLRTDYKNTKKQGERTEKKRPTFSNCLEKVSDFLEFSQERDRCVKNVENSAWLTGNVGKVVGVFLGGVCRRIGVFQSGNILAAMTRKTPQHGSAVLTQALKTVQKCWAAQAFPQPRLARLPSTSPHRTPIAVLREKVRPPPQ